MSSADYSARHLSVLEGLEAVRKRPGMYIGSTDSRGLMHCLWEIIDNSVDEALGGHGSRDRRRAARRRERRGARPRARHPGRHRAEDGLSAASRSSSRSCTPAASSAPARTRRPAVCTASAPRSSTRSPSGSTSRSTATARPGRCRSTAASPASSPTRGEPTPGRAVHAVRLRQRAARRRQGRQGRDRHARPVLGRPADLHQGRAASRPTSCSTARDRPRSWCPARASTSTTSAATTPVRESFHFAGGISEFVDHLAPDAPITDTWRLTGTGTFTETVPVLAGDGRDGADRAAARVRRSTSPCAGAPATTPCSRASSTSSRRPRAARTRPASSRACSSSCAREVEKNARRLKVRHRQAREG